MFMVVVMILGGWFTLMRNAHVLHSSDVHGQFVPGLCCVQVTGAWRIHLVLKASLSIDTCLDLHSSDNLNYLRACLMLSEVAA